MSVLAGSTKIPKHTHNTMVGWYMRAQGRCLALLELWAIARGDDFRPDKDFVSVGKVFGTYVREGIVGPDRMYKMQVLKDVAKHNKSGRNELVGVTRHKDPLFCAINATAAMLILRWGRGGVIGELPDFFDPMNDWPDENSLFTNEGGDGIMPYNGAYDRQGHVQLFRDMKTAAGLEHLMNDCVTKLRSFGAMHAAEGQADHAEVERMGRSELATRHQSQYRHDIVTISPP